MRLTVLGGSAASPGPGQGCSSYLVEANGFRLVLDAGPDTLAELRRHASLSQIDAVVISHLHADHTLDLVPLRYGLKYAPNAPSPRVALHMPPKGMGFLNALASVFAIGSESTQSFFDEVFDPAEYDPDQELRLGPFSLTFAPTRHFVPCWAMRIVQGDRTLVYLADTAPHEPLIDFAAGADLLICEATLPPGHDTVSENAGHLSAEQAGDIAAAARVQRLMLTHLWAEFDPEGTRRAAMERFAGPVIVAAPGRTVDV